MNLVDIDPGRCQANLDSCINPLSYPNNPFNDDYDCADLPEEETEVFVFPTTEESGPVVLWKINYHNHDYPNKRRSSRYGPTEFFFGLKTFFDENRGRYGRGYRVTETTTHDRACSDPWDFDGFAPPEGMFRYDYWSNQHGGVSPDKCREKCEADFRCTDAFYGDYGDGTEFCKL